MKRITGGFEDALEYARRQVAYFECNHYVILMGTSWFVTVSEPALQPHSPAYVVVPGGGYCELAEAA